ncbi:hypothetical protein [Tenacibaculum finnmarkense]|uniref:hypothetical protein n=1 Tax=Tenacibaculum finnmarkense TaxID=2781243 RepID=UPI001E53B6E3|nr:hypothetical protein [Tenacibaculum finnmarkense]MCD8413702.1 hypothetical protein [Tenacibaculum finnmarkense genomovar ulcerans]
MKVLKIIFIVIGVLVLMPITTFSGLLIYDSYYESKFMNIDIPENMRFEKPNEELGYLNINSLTEDKIEITGNGYFGYNFHMWHKPTEKGYVFVKAVELTQNIELSEPELENRTKNEISELSNNYVLYEGESLIYEGTFEQFYPVRFEMWFRSKETRTERKLAEKKYLIDGWDR